MKINFQFNSADLAKTMKKMQSDYEKEITEAIAVATRQTSYNAKSFAPVDKSRLKNSIRPVIKGMTGEIVVGVNYGPYQEFGTGNLVNVPSELSSYAMQFKGRGIRQVNTRPQPYLYPAFFLQRDKFVSDMNSRINKIGNKDWR